MSLNTGLVPQDWKEAGVSPLFKKGSKSLPENYRPVSLTSTVGTTIRKHFQGSYCSTFRQI